MKIIDKTPFQDEKGQIDFLARLQGTLKYGPNWYPDMQAQRRVMAQLDRLLEKGFVLIRNFTLPDSEVTVPFILVGPQGVSVLYVTGLKGVYEARGDQWNRVDNGRSMAAPVNLLSRAVRLARATQIYLDRQKITLMSVVEPVLIAANPGLQIDSMRPVARVVMSDAIRQFAGGMLQGRPVLRPEQVYDLADRIVTPRKVEPEPEPMPPFSTEPASAPGPETAPARARAIFDAAETAAPFDPSDLSFAFEDEVEPDFPPGRAPEANPGIPVPEDWTRTRLLNMSLGQLGCLGAMVVLELIILVVGAYYIFTGP
ncbi:MAG: NERD domain-containing protein [Bacteroidota bacterium]